MDYIGIASEAIVQMARLALAGRRQDIQMYVRKLARKVRGAEPALAEKLTSLLEELPSPTSPVRSATMAAVPVDQDSSLQLLRVEHPVQIDVEPIWPDDLRQRFEQVLHERMHAADLELAGLSPTRSLLFHGEPGVGKTLAARWLASKLGLPLLILDLSAVMSSFLGRTGANLRNVFDYAKGADCVLLLDEIDAVAKRRDDIAELGELKRLVTVLNQEIDDWPPRSLLLGATNHPDLLDPAVWRRFDIVVEFPMPSHEQTVEAVRMYFGSHLESAHEWLGIMAILLHGFSFSDIERELARLRRRAVVTRSPLEGVLKEWAKSRFEYLPRPARQKAALDIVAAGHSQRQASDWTGVSRDTIRKARRPGEAT